MRYLIIVIAIVSVSFATVEEFKWWSYDDPEYTGSFFKSQVWVKVYDDSLSYIHTAIVYGDDPAVLSNTSVAYTREMHRPTSAQKRYPTGPAQYSEDLGCWYVSYLVEANMWNLTGSPYSYFMLYSPSSGGRRRTEGDTHTYWALNTGAPEACVVFYETEDTSLSRTTWAGIKSMF